MEANEAPKKKKAKKAKKATKKEKDPNEPKRPNSAYQMWMYDPAVYARINADKPAGKGGFFKHAAEWWKELSEEEKKPYEDRYEAAMKQWKQAKSDYHLQLAAAARNAESQEAPESQELIDLTDSQPIDLDAFA